MPLVLDGTNGVSGVDGTASNPAIEGTDSNTGIFYPAADTVAIGTGGTERLRVDSAGNAGLGVTPSAWSSSFKALNIGVNGQSVSADGGQIIIGSNYVQESGGARYVVSAAAGSYSISRNSHAWYIAPSGTAGNAITFTQAMTLDASGWLGIVTTSPRGRLHVGSDLSSGATDASTGINLKQSSTTAATGFYIERDGERRGYYMYIGGALDSLTFQCNALGTKTDVMSLTRDGNVGVGTGSPGAKLAVSVGNATGFRVDTTTANESLIVAGSGSNLQVRHPAAGVELFNSGGNAFRIVANTNGVSLAVNGTSWGAISDERLKDIIEPITNASEKVASLRAVIGKYKTDEEGVRRSFLIAQDVNAVLPEAVVTSSEDDDTLLLQYTDTIPLLVAAIKEQQAMIDEMKAEIATLKAQP